MILNGWIKTAWQFEKTALFRLQEYIGLFENSSPFILPINRNSERAWCIMYPTKLENVFLHLSCNLQGVNSLHKKKTKIAMCGKTKMEVPFTQYIVEPVIIMSPAEMTMVQTVPKLNTFLYCQFGPFFEIHNGQNSIWEWFGPTIISAGLIILTGSTMTPNQSTLVSLLR